MRGISTSMRFPDLRDRPFLAAILALVAIRVSILWLDRPLAHVMSGAPPWLRDLAEWVTRLGRSDLYLVPLGVAILLILVASRYLEPAPRRATARSWAWVAGFVWLSVALSGLLIDVVKLIAGRPRPIMADAHSDPFTFGYAFQSFPSGHTTVAFGLALSLSLLWPRWRWPLILFAVAVAASRVILLSHYLGDTLGGALAAWLTVTWLANQFARRGLVFKRDERGRLVRRSPAAGS